MKRILKMMNKAFASALLLTMLVGCGLQNSPIGAGVQSSAVSAQSVGILPVRQALTSRTIAEATADVHQALDVHIPDATTTTTDLAFEPTDQMNLLTFTGIAVHYGMAFRFESPIAGTVDLDTGKVVTTPPQQAN